jgi:hypothetical protein
MTKLLFGFILLAAGYLFYPFWDLYVRDDPFNPEYHQAGSGYWTRKACVEAADAQLAREFRCRKRTTFSTFLGTSSNYSKPSVPG